MLKTVFSKTYYEKRWILLFWFIGILFMTWVTMLFFPYLRDTFDQVLSNSPKGLQSLLGTASDYKTVQGYVGQQIFALRLPLMMLILSISIFGGLSAGDEERGTLETLLSLPVSRLSVFWQKFAAGALLTFLASLAIFVGVLLSFVNIHATMSLWNLALATFACWLVSLCFGAFTYSLGMLSGRRGITIGLSSAVAFAMYLVTSLAPMTSVLDQAQKFSLFYYYNSPAVATNGLKFFNVSVLVLVIVVCLGIGLLVFRRRDLRRD